MDKSFEQIAKRQRATYTANPGRYHPTGTKRSLAPVIAAAVCIAAAFPLAYYSEPLVVDNFRDWLPKKATELGAFYYRALIAYYAVALFAAYLAFSAILAIEPRIGGKDENDPMHLGYIALNGACYAGTMLILGFLSLPVVPYVPGKVQMIQNFGMLALGTWAYFAGTMSALELFYRRPRMHARNDQ